MCASRSRSTGRWPPLALVAAGLTLLVAAPAQATPVSRPLAQLPAQGGAYWTPERMREAASLPLPASSGAPVSTAARSSAARGRPTQIAPSSPISYFDYQPGAETAFPQSVHGKFFFTIPDVGDAACSGTVVASRLKNVVFTAGHCVHYPGAAASTNVVFVPGYRDGALPFGLFPAASVLVPEEWTLAFDPSYDVAIAQLGVPLEASIGARGIAFNKPPRTSYRIFGYPGEPSPPYDGERLVGCDAPFFGLEAFASRPFSPVAYPCEMRQGASGGGWVNPSGEVVSVVSHGYADPSRNGQIAGPYFGDTVKRLYNAAGGSAQCPPARKALTKARKRAKKARTAERRRDTRRADRRLRRASKRLNKAQRRRDAVC